jgi:hypothetical protein
VTRPFTLEHAHGLAHRAPADLELVGHLLFTQPAAGRQLAAQDASRQFGGQLVGHAQAQRRPVGEELEAQLLLPAGEGIFGNGGRA